MLRSPYQRAHSIFQFVQLPVCIVIRELRCHDGDTNPAAENNKLNYVNTIAAREHMLTSSPCSDEDVET